MPPRPLKHGTKIEFIARHLELTNAEMVEAAKEEKVKLSVAHIDSVRWYLRTKHGYKNTGSKPRKKKASTALVKGVPKAKTYVARAKKKKEAKESNGVSPERGVKHAQLRKLVFDLGWDEVRTIFLEFEEMHNRWS